MFTFQSIYILAGQFSSNINDHNTPQKYFCTSTLFIAAVILVASFCGKDWSIYVPETHLGLLRLAIDCRRGGGWGWRGVLGRNERGGGGGRGFRESKTTGVVILSFKFKMLTIVLWNSLWAKCSFWRGIQKDLKGQILPLPWMSYLYCQCSILWIEI